MTDLYRIRVLALEKPARRVTLRVFSVCYDASYVRPGIPTDASLFMRILSSDAGLGRGEPLRQEVSDDHFFDEAWIDANTQRFIQRVTRTRLQNDPPAKDKQPPTYVDERFKDEDILTQADFEVVVTDPRWIEHLTVGMTWQTSASATRATMPRGRATVLADEKASKALRKAIQQADLLAIRAAVSAGAPLNPRFAQGDDWPLSDACDLVVEDGPAMRVVELLVALGADVNHRISDADSAPLLRAAHASRDVLARWLVAHGASIEERDPTDDASMLHCAAAGGLLWLVDLCLAQGADPNARTLEGATPLHVAAAAGNPSIVAALLAKGADKTLKTTGPWRCNAKFKEGVTAVDVARQLQHHEAEAWLR